MMRMLVFIIAIFFLFLFSGCEPDRHDEAKEEQTPSRFQLLSATATGIDFSNDLTPDYDHNILEFNYFYNGGGVAIGDVNNDSLPDIYFTGNMVSSRLYLNQGNLTFKDVTKSAGVSTDRWATGVSMVDINQDGYLDIYVCFSADENPENRANQLFINNGISSKDFPTFTEAAAAYGLADTGYSTQAAFLDYDRDGDLDMYLLTVFHDKTNPNQPKPKVNDGSALSTDKLYRNEGTGPDGHPTFKDVSEEAGIVYEGYGLGVAVSDVNQDGWPDVYIANDFVYDDLLYINQSDGSFTESAAQYLKHQSRFSMGCDIADFNNDGLTDIVVLDMLPDDNYRQKMMSTAMNYDRFQLTLAQGYQPQYSRNMLQMNNGNRSFSEIGYLAGIYKTDWSWSALFGDYDNDGFHDLLVTNGIPKDITDHDFILYRDTHIRPGFQYDELKKDLLKKIETLSEVRKPNFIFSNNGTNAETALTFSDKTLAWGIEQPSCSNGAAYADLDKDGDLDLVVNNINETAFIYKNNSDTLGNNFVRFQLMGDSLNRMSIGAKVYIHYDGQMQFYEHFPSRGFQSSVEPMVHFGIGQATLVDSVEIIWPDGKYQRLYDIQGNAVHIIKYASATNAASQKTQEKKTLFKEVAVMHDIHFTHIENDFVDFKWEPLLPHKYSQNGPGIAVGDVNGDGLDDFVIGGATQTPGKVFYQNAQSRFKSIDLPDKGYEDQGLLLFDADNDQDLDLYVVSGGSEFNANSAPYEDRLYVNDGRGNFSRDAAALPPIYTSGSCVTAADYDQDGDLDLFVGGRLYPGKYPLSVKSYILNNEGGKFADVTREVCPDLQEIGLVTSALWTDFDNDTRLDLIVAGEWMPLTFFKNNGKTFTNVTEVTTLKHTSGWWNSLVAGDFDNDGDTDYVAGNLGLNAKYKVSPQEPVRVHAKDFDQDGKLDAILSHYIQGKNYPAHPRDALIEQMVAVRKKFPRYADYARSTFDEIFSEQELEGAYSVKSDNFRSCYIENLGQGRFSIKPLPLQAQTAPIFGMLAGDYNQNGHLDLLLTGNSYASEFMAGRYDAFIGLFLQGDGKGNFKVEKATESGFFVDGDAKGLAEITLSNQKSLILAASNADVLKVFASSENNHELITLAPMDAWATLTFSAGNTRRQEFYYGMGYLSQSSRVLPLPKDVTFITIYDYTGKGRTVEKSERISEVLR